VADFDSFLRPWPYIAHREPSPARPLLPEWVRDGDTCYWWPCAAGSDWAEIAAVRRAAVEDGDRVYLFQDGPFTILVVRGVSG
jgi:hypothetical protein